MKTYLKKLIYGNILLNVIFSIAGLFLIIKPGLSVELISVMVGLIIIMSSLISIIKFISDSTKKKFYKYEIILGILGLVLGILIVFNPLKIFNIFIMGLGIWLIIKGLLKLWYGMYLKKFKEEIWSLTLAIGIISTILGITLIINPFSGVMVFTTVLGIFIISNSVLEIISSLLFRKRIQELIKILN